MLTHRRCLRADHLSLDSRGNSFALIQRQAERLRNRPILPFYSSHLDLGRWFACLGKKFHPPNQLPHSAVSLPKARSLAFKNLLAPHDFACSPYLLRKLAIERPNHVWCADVTYIPMRRGFLYLVAVIDWATRKVLAWRLSNTMEADFCVAALNHAMDAHGRPEIFNTDQGSQFTSHAFTGAQICSLAIPPLRDFPLIRRTPTSSIIPLLFIVFRRL